MSKLGALRPKGQHILVVDDEQDILDSLKDLFTAMLEDVEVATALTGEEGLRILAEDDIDLVISDYRMPGMDGLAFLTECRQVAPEAGRILITAFPELDVAMRAINEASIENFFTKPLSTDKVLEAVNAALVKKRAGQ